MTQMPLACPTFRDYSQWAQKQGFIVESFEMTRGMFFVNCLSVRTSGGRRVVEFFEGWDDPLLSTTVARLDRGLGAKSLFFT